MGVQEAGAVLRRKSQNVDGDRGQGVGIRWLLCREQEGEQDVGLGGCQTLELELSSVVMGSLPRGLKQGVM